MQLPHVTGATCCKKQQSDFLIKKTVKQTTSTSDIL